MMPYFFSDTERKQLNINTKKNSLCSIVFLAIRNKNLVKKSFTCRSLIVKTCVWWVVLRFLTLKIILLNGIVIAIICIIWQSNAMSYDKFYDNLVKTRPGLALTHWPIGTPCNLHYLRQLIFNQIIVQGNQSLHRKMYF